MIDQLEKNQIQTLKYLIDTCQKAISVCEDIRNDKTSPLLPFRYKDIMNLEKNIIRLVQTRKHIFKEIKKERSIKVL